MAFGRFVNSINYVCKYEWCEDGRELVGWINSRGNINRVKRFPGLINGEYNMVFYCKPNINDIYDINQNNLYWIDIYYGRLLPSQCTTVANGGDLKFDGDNIKFLSKDGYADVLFIYDKKRANCMYVSSQTDSECNLLNRYVEIDTLNHVRHNTLSFLVDKRNKHIINGIYYKEPSYEQTYGSELPTNIYIRDGEILITTPKSFHLIPLGERVPLDATHHNSLHDIRVYSENNIPNKIEIETTTNVEYNFIIDKDRKSVKWTSNYDNKGGTLQTNIKDIFSK